MDRRRFLTLSASFLATLLGHPAYTALAQQPEAPAAGENGGVSFSWDWLVARMKARAGVAYEDTRPQLPELVSQLGYDSHRRIRYRPEKALWRDEGRNFELQAFYPGGLFNRPVELFEVADGAARPLIFTPQTFEFREPLDTAAFEALPLPGVAGFRLHYPLNRSDYRDEVVSFLGSSYFRALGRGNQYGISARGLAIDTASGSAEEFPAFTRFYLQRPEAGAREIKVFAELESQRVSGAYAFTVVPGVETRIEVEAAIFLRGDVARLGLAPLTSMYLFGENDRTGFDDFRPEVHDSDGLAIVGANGERTWRPLTNPKALQLSVFGETNPRGFGLLQRDRQGDNYLDLEARYERRPSVWIEPIGDWGRGAVWLAEIPSELEIHDNIVAFWMPEKGLEAGSEHWLHYRMLWAADVEGDVPVARAMRTRTGHGGMAGGEPDPDLRKFMIDFEGPTLAGLGADAQIRARAGAGNGEVVHQQLTKLEGRDVWRLILDVRRNDADRPVELRASLEGEARLTETWTYQWGRAK